MPIHFGPRNGQVLLMYTVALFALIGMLGLAVDLGLSHYTKRAAQSAADVAAMAAALQAQSALGVKSAYELQTSWPSSVVTSTITCGAGVTASDVETNNLKAGCLYAKQHGFVNGDQQTVQLTGAAGDPPALNVSADYYVTARISQADRSMFSAIWGGSTTTVAAIATAVVAQRPEDSSLMMTNRVQDLSPIGQGVNIYLSGSGTVTVPGGLRMASTAATGAKSSVPYNAGRGVSNSGGVTSQYTYINANGWVDDPTKYTPRPERKADGANFLDPMRDLKQPDASGARTSSICAVPGGVIPDGAVLSPGYYYTVPKQGGSARLGDPLSVNGNVYFSAKPSGTVHTDSSGVADWGANCYVGDATDLASFGNPADKSAFGYYVLVGGLGNKGAHAVLNLQSGMYFLAGTQWSGGGGGGHSATLANNDKTLNLDNAATLTDLRSDAAPDLPGEMFVLTDGNYPFFPQAPIGADTSQLNSVLSLMNMAPSSLQAGSGPISMNLHGLNADHTTIKGLAMTGYAGLMFWQDRRNSSVRYNDVDSATTAPGHISCGDYNSNTNSYSSADPTAGCGNTYGRVDSNFGSTQFFYQGNSQTNLYGVFYQPRGSYLKLGGGTMSSTTSRLFTVTGAVEFSGNSNLTVPGAASWVRRVVALVQ